LQIGGTPYLGIFFSSNIKRKKRKNVWKNMGNIEGGCEDMKMNEFQK
jgi:hypothetical protein